MEYLDIIEKLQNKGIDHVLEKIFKSFDYYCLRRAELVSPVWEETIRNSKIWKKLFVSNLETPNWRKTLSALNGMSHKDLPHQQGMTEDDLDYYRKLCCLIESEAELLDYNWKRMKHEDKDKLFDVRSSTLSFGPTHKLDSTGNLLIVLDNNKREIILVNRWTLQIEKVLEFPIMQVHYRLFNPEIKLRNVWTQKRIRPEDSNPIISYVEVNENFIIATIKEQTEICVWDAKTYDLLKVLDYKDIHFGNYQFLNPVCHRLWGNLLLTCHRNEEDCQVFALIRLPPDLDQNGEPVLLADYFLGEESYRVMGMSFDENLIIMHCDTMMFSVSGGSDSCTTRFEILKTSSFEHISTIEYRYWDRHFDYRNQILISVSSYNKCIRIFDAETGTCIRKISQSDEICAVNIINDKYFVTCDTRGKCRVWDLSAAINKSITKQKLVLNTIPLPYGHSSSDSVSIRFVKADEYQIIIGEMLSDAQGRRQTRVFTKTFLGVV